MNRSVRLVVDLTNRLVTFLAIHVPKGRQDNVIFRFKNPPAKRQRQSMFEPVDLVFVGIKLDIH